MKIKFQCHFFFFSLDIITNTHSEFTSCRVFLADSKKQNYIHDSDLRSSSYTERNSI